MGYLYSFEVLISKSIKIKTKKMKKFLAIALIAGSLVACNSGETKEEAAPAPETTTETPAAETPAPEATAPVADTTAAAAPAATPAPAAN